MIAASGERQQFVVPAASFGNVRNVAPQGAVRRGGRYQASRGSDSRTPLVATVSNGWSLGSRSTLNAGVLVSARTAHWPPGFQSTPAMRSALRSACARPAPASRARSSRASRSRRTCRPRRSSACPRACRPPCRRKAIATWRRWCRRRARMPGSCPARARPTPPACPGSPRPWAPFPQPIPPAACPARKASAQPRDAVLEPELRPHLGQPVHGQDLSTGTRARSENQYFLTLSFPWAAPAPAPMSASQAIAAVLALLTPTPSARSSATASARASPGRRRGQFVGIDRRDAALRARQPVRQPGFARRRVDELGVQGSVVGAGGAVAFSPYEVGDTFGIAKVGDLGGVEIQTPSGPVWTDAWGNAVIPD